MEAAPLDRRERPIVDRAIPGIRSYTTDREACKPEVEKFDPRARRCALGENLTPTP
jgi:hypothetical protein